MDPGSQTNITEITRDYNPSMKIYEWPMEDGNWHVDTTETVITNIGGFENTVTNTLSFDVNTKEVSKEDIKGTTYVVVKLEMSIDGKQVDIWYSPDVGNVVKEQDADGNYRELKSHACNDPGKIEGDGSNGGGGGWDPMAMGEICYLLPVVAGLTIGAVYGTIIGMYSGYTSKLPKIKRKKGKSRASRRPPEMDGPKFCPRHGCRTEKKDGGPWCPECEGSPMMGFKYCPHHGVKIKDLDGAPLCEDCGGEVKW
jgi:hypothetical protein